MREESRRVLEAFPYGLYAIAVEADGAANAFTANWITQVSGEPPMVAAAIESSAHSLELIRAARAFSVNLWAEGQRREAALLARPWTRAPDKLSRHRTRAGTTGAPILQDALAYLECRVVAELVTGDHTLVVGEVVDGGLLREGRPLTMESAGFTYTGR